MEVEERTWARSRMGKVRGFLSSQAGICGSLVENGGLEDSSVEVHRTDLSSPDSIVKLSIPTTTVIGGQR